MKNLVCNVLKGLGVVAVGYGASLFLYTLSAGIRGGGSFLFSFLFLVYGVGGGALFFGFAMLVEYLAAIQENTAAAARNGEVLIGFMTHAAEGEGPAVRTCPGCGAALVPSAAMCMKCGRQLGD